MMRIALLVVAVGLGGGCRAAEDEASAGPARRPGEKAGAVLVELFTSQGCSSCPPADRLLPLLPGAVDGVEVLPLAFHDDYWDDLGWRDPFSSAAWSERQRRYAPAVSDGRVYTPQMVVQGRADLNGADRSGAIDAIRRAAEPAPRGRISAVTTGGEHLTVTVDAALPAGKARADAWVALTESGLSTRVARGENKGLEMINDHVVRRLSAAFTVEAGASRQGKVDLPIDPSWRRDHLDVIVFLQDPASQRVLAAARAVR